MHGESPHGHDAEPGRAPLPPATTRWSQPDGPDPGADGQRLAPFRAGAPAHAVATPPVEPVAAPAPPVPTPAPIEPPEELEQPVIAAAVEEMGLIDEPARERIVAEERGGEEPWTIAPAEDLIETAPAAGVAALDADYDGTAEDVTPAVMTPPAVAPWEGLPEADYFSAQSAELEVEALPVEDEPWTLTADAVVEEEPEPVVEPWAAAPDQEMVEAAPVLELIDEVEAPVDEVEAAVDAVEAPVDAVEVPVDAAEAPADEVEAPAAEVAAPAEAEAIADVEAPVAEVEAPVPPLDSVPEHQQWDAFGRALKEAVSWEGAPAAREDAPPPWMAQQILREESSAEEWQTAAGLAPREEPSEPEVAAASEQEAAAVGGDAFSGELADRLQSLADRLRSQGAGAIADALSSGDRLEASIALFLAGYQVGRGR
jgi:hypothetical protein